MAGEKPHAGLHARVSGRVQGVAFRAATQAEARRLGLTGWVRNLHDGRVELQAFGTQEKLEELRAWLKHGPPMAHVLKLDCKPIDYAAYTDFAILETS
ncbi:MAG: acylphosphatase, partial [Gammaproteobacteria bacterium]